MPGKNGVHHKKIFWRGRQIVFRRAMIYLMDIVKAHLHMPIDLCMANQVFAMHRTGSGHTAIPEE